MPEVSTTLPHFPHPENADADEVLWQQLNKRLIEKTDGSEKYKDRLQYEFDVITKMGYSDYFLIVSDAVNYAKNNDIYVGPGRGSSSASLVSYLLNITEVDPLKYNLLFERIHFSEDRKSTRLNSSHVSISYAVFCLKKKKL